MTTLSKLNNPTKVLTYEEIDLNKIYTFQGTDHTNICRGDMSSNFWLGMENDYIKETELFYVRGELIKKSCSKLFDSREYCYGLVIRSDYNNLLYTLYFEGREWLFREYIKIRYPV